MTRFKQHVTSPQRLHSGEHFKLNSNCHIIYFTNKYKIYLYRWIIIYSKVLFDYWSTDSLSKQKRILSGRITTSYLRNTSRQYSHGEPLQHFHAVPVSLHSSYRVTQSPRHRDEILRTNMTHVVFTCDFQWMNEDVNWGLPWRHINKYMLMLIMFQVMEGTWS